MAFLVFMTLLPVSALADPFFTWTIGVNAGVGEHNRSNSEYQFAQPFVAENAEWTCTVPIPEGSKISDPRGKKDFLETATITCTHKKHPDFKASTSAACSKGTSDSGSLQVTGKNKDLFILVTCEDR